MASLAQAQLTVPVPPIAASEAVVQILRDADYRLDEASVPGAAEILFGAKRTVLYVARQGGARISEHGSGSLIELGIDVAPGQPAGLMDGKRNRKLLDELSARITATLGSA